MRRLSATCDWCTEKFEEPEVEEEADDLFFDHHFFKEGWVQVITGVDNDDELDFCSTECIARYFSSEG
jgi:hypothetical protein